MSIQYDEYLVEHIGNVGKGLQWMLDSLPLNQEQITAIEEAIQHAHDQSKYDKEEYNAYDAYFYGGNRSFKVCQEFDYAWLRHIHHNPHHWQYWVLMEDDPETGRLVKPLKIPLKYIYEMIADWWSFSWKNNNLFEIFTWYGEHRIKQIMHPETRAIVEDILKKMWKVLVMTEVRNGKDRDELERQYISYWIESPRPEIEPEIKIEPVDISPHVVFGHSDTGSQEIVFKPSENAPDEIILEAAAEGAHLEHHGILGQKWGVRRYQNKDGTRTAEGKKLERYRRRTVRELENVDAVNKIVASLPREEQLALGVGRDDKEWIPKDRRAEISSNIAKTFIEYDGDEPVSMLEIWDIGDGKADIAIATNPKYRGTGVTSKNIKAAVDWFNSGNNKEFDQLQWNNLKMNAKSGQIAEHYGFGDYDEDDKWEYRRIFKDEPIKHSDSEDDEDLYGVPKLKKFPMPDKKHVKSAIRFFNYVDPKYEKELAEAILEKAEEFGLDLEEDITVGDENRFKKYLPKKEEEQS